MTHLTELQCSLYADAALSSDAATEIGHHLEKCTICRSRIDVFIAENQVISNMMNIKDLIPVPKFQRPVSMKEMAFGAVMIALLTWITQTLWSSLNGEPFARVFSWFSSFNLSDGIAMTLDAAIYFSQHGTDLFNAIANYTVAGLMAAAFVYLLMRYQQTRSALCLGVLIVGAGVYTPPADAFEVRSGEDLVTVTIDETINDTLVIKSEIAVIEGTVNGDLIAMSRRVIIKGKITGNVIVVGKAVRVSGEMGGSFLGAASSVELVDATVKGNFWAGGDSVSMDSESQVMGNTAIATGVGTFAGKIGRDLIGVGENIVLSGETGKDFNGYWDHVSLLDNARIGGDFQLWTDNKDNLQQILTTVVAGNVEILPTESQQDNKYLTGNFYILQVLRLASAFILGIALFWFFPRFQSAKLNGGIVGLKTAGIGLITLVSMPIIMLLIAFTIVGIPITFIGLFLWLVFIYFAKIVLAAEIGRVIFSALDKYSGFKTLLFAGLGLIVIVTSLPVVGCIFNFIFTIIGIGLIVQVVMSYTSALSGDRIA